MSFEAFAQQCAGFIVGGPTSEEIGYRAAGALDFPTRNAVVDRQPVEPTGGVLRNQVHVFLSKADVPKVRLGEDHIRLPKDNELGQPPPEYVVESVLSQSAGWWTLLCVR